MQTEVHSEANNAGAQDASACPNCHNLMPNGMRFCRACGCRLGEGIEEYTETVRLDGARATAGAARTKTASAVPPANVKDWGGVARNAREHVVRSVTTGLGPWKVARTCTNRVPKWMIWVFLPIIAVSIMGGISSNKRIRGAKGGSSAAASSNAPSFMGAQYKTAQGGVPGVFVRDVTPPGSAADKAGLLGGDIITSFDNKPVKSEDELTNLLVSTPVGKTVDVTFIRDGETKTVKLTTISENDNDNLREAFEDGPKGFLGVNDNFQRAQVPNTNIYGVQLKQVYKNRPGYIAGLRDGDIVIEFNGTPIRTTEEFNDRIDRAAPDSTVKVVVMRGSERQEIMVKVGDEDD